MNAAQPISFFVKVDCNAHSRHRDPGGIYIVEVLPEKTVQHCAYAAIQVAKTHVPFVDENIDKISFKVYDTEGSEVPVSSVLDVEYEEHGTFNGRAIQYPEEITIQ